MLSQLAARSQHQHVVAVMVALRSREADFVEALMAVARGVLRLLPAHGCLLRADAKREEVLRVMVVLDVVLRVVGFGDSADVARVLTVLVLDQSPPQRDCAPSAQLSHDPINRQQVHLFTQAQTGASDRGRCCRWL